MIKLFFFKGGKEGEPGWNGSLARTVNLRDSTTGTWGPSSERGPSASSVRGRKGQTPSSPAAEVSNISNSECSKHNTTQKTKLNTTQIYILNNTNPSPTYSLSLSLSFRACTCMTRVEKWLSRCSGTLMSGPPQTGHTMSLMCLSLTATVKCCLKHSWHTKHWHEVRDCIWTPERGGKYGSFQTITTTNCLRVCL